MSNWRLDIDEEIFSVPEGNVRGVLVGRIQKKRLLHALIKTDAPPSISTWTLSKPNIDDLRAFAELLSSFANRLAELES